MPKKVFKAKRCNDIDFMSVEEGVLLGFSGTPQPAAFVLPSINEIVFAIIFILLTVIVAFVVIKIIQRTSKCFNIRKKKVWQNLFRLEFIK